VYSADEVAGFHAAFGASNVEALLIHAVYLLNCASEDPQIRARSSPRRSRSPTTARCTSRTPPWCTPGVSGRATLDL